MFYCDHRHGAHSHTHTQKCEKCLSYRSARKIKDYIVRSKLYPVERKVGCRGCRSSRCQVCKSISITEEFTSFTTKKTYKINHSFDCNDKCLIYLLSCNSSGKQYVDNNTDHFRSRWDNYKSDARKAESGDMENVKQKFLESHFLLRDHQGFLKDVKFRLIDKTQASDPFKSEFYWVRTLRTLYPDDLNIEVTINSLFRLTHTFTVMFGPPSTRVYSSAPAIAFS